MIEAVQTEGGKILVSLKRVCESLGLAFQVQHRKLQNCQWACITMMVTRDTKGRRQQALMIDHESLPMWLVTISPSKVKAAARPKLLQYQREAKAVLAARFLGHSTEAPSLAAEFADVNKQLASGQPMAIITTVAQDGMRWDVTMIDRAGRMRLGLRHHHRDAGWRPATEG